MSAARYYFDGVGVGRPAPEVGAALSAYSRLERVLSAPDLHALHTTGSDILGASDLATEHSVLVGWDGFEGFEHRLIRSLGLATSDPRRVLLHYGSTTGAVFAAVARLLVNEKTFWLENFYDPWAAVLARTQSFSSPIATRDVLGGASTEQVHDNLVERVVEAVCSGRPRVVALPLVTQLGLRVPVEAIVRGVLARWHVPAPSWYPLFLLDGCQAFGRVAFSLGAGSLSEMGCLFVGCFHKAMQATKGQAFLVCTNAAWRRRLADLNSDLGGPGDLFSYARGQRGRGSSTVSPAGVIAANARLLRRSPDLMSAQFRRVTALESALRERLDANWKVLNPADHRLWSGILALRRTDAMDTSAASARDMLAMGTPCFVVGAVRNNLRIALDPDHELADVEALGRGLAELASVMRRAA